jgi:hypothetical protein
MTTMRNSQSTILVFVAITAAIEAVLADNPDADLLEIEQLFRAAASAAYLVATAEGFAVIIGMKNWVAELNRLGRTPEENRDALAGESPDTA